MVIAAPALCYEGGVDDPRVHLPDTNLRELGGYPTPDGTVRRGVLFRGGRMDELDDAGMALYRSLGLHTIVDLRREDEVADAPTPTFGDERNVHVSVSQGSNDFAVAAGHASNPDRAGEVLPTALTYFRTTVTERIDRWIPVFDAVLDADGAPVLFHCTAGKDRTGFLAAALLKFLDADDDTVFDDFELTNEVRRPFVDARIEFHRQRMADEHGIDPADIPQASIDAWRTLMSSSPEFLHEVYRAVEETYGDWHTMRRDGLGIDDDRLAAWRAAVVE